MSNFGLSKPWFAELDQTTNKYSKAFKCGKLVSTSVTPNYNTGTTYADNQVDEDVSEFRDATLALVTNCLPKEAVELMFGHKIAENGEQTDNSEDYGKYLGYGFITREIKSGKKTYRACILFKTKFTEGAESYTTKGENIEFQNPNIAGKAYTLENGDWRKKSPTFNTEEEADKWIQDFFKGTVESTTPESGTENQ